jgi:hypothetical protein
VSQIPDVSTIFDGLQIREHSACCGLMAIIRKMIASAQSGYTRDLHVEIPDYAPKYHFRANKFQTQLSLLSLINFPIVQD